jgi:RNA polymerase sigma factor (sigma-70 family)
MVAHTPVEYALAGRFPSTRWSRVIAAGGRNSSHARESLAEVCDAYWYPLYAYIRRRGHSPDEAQDLTQDLFAYLLEHRVIANADPERGRFRAFLRTICTRFLANAHDRATARKRGGGRRALPIEAFDAEGRYARELADLATPDKLFDRTWALTVLALALEQLRREYDDSGRSAVFRELQGILGDDPGSVHYGSIAQRLCTSEGAVRVAVHRLRRRYAVLLRLAIASTVDSEAEIDDEIRSLFIALET